MGESRSRSLKKVQKVVIPKKGNAALLICGLIILGVIVLPGFAFWVGGTDSRLLIMALCGSAVAVSCLGSWSYRAVTATRLLVLKDRVQLIQGRDNLVGQVMYDNLRGVEVLSLHDGNRQGGGAFRYSVLALIVEEPDDRDNWWPEADTDPETEYFLIRPGYTRRVDAIGKLIYERVKRFQEGC